MDYSPFSAGHVMVVDLNRCLFLDEGSVAMQAFVQICREFQTALGDQFLRYGTIAFVKSSITQGMQFIYVFLLLGQFLHPGVITSVNGRIAQGLQFGYVFRSWRLARPQRGTDCVIGLPTRSGTLTIANSYMSCHELREFRFFAFRPYVFGFVLSGRLFYQSVAGKFWVTLHGKVGNFQKTMHEFSGIVLSGVASCSKELGKVFYPAPGLFNFGLDIQRILRWYACFQCWPLMYFITVRLAEGADLEPYCMDSENAFPLEAICRRTTRSLFRGWCPSCVQPSV